MKNKWQRISALLAVTVFGALTVVMIVSSAGFEITATAQTKPTPTQTPFDQSAALANLREQIKGKENEPAEKVFKNVQVLKGVPAGRLLAIMNFGYSRALGVDCTHCHTPEKWESEEKQTKQIARGMKEMSDKINSDLLKNMKGLGGREAIVNCSTCHRGEVKPALNVPMQTVPKSQ